MRHYIQRYAPQTNSIAVGQPRPARITNASIIRYITGYIRLDTGMRAATSSHPHVPQVALTYTWNLYCQLPGDYTYPV
jgi:hypothetical protein